MRKSLTKRFCLIASLLYFSSLIFTSCDTTKRIKYFQDIPDSGQLKAIAKAEYTEPIIRVGDALAILVQTIDPLSVSMVNAGNTTSGINPLPSAISNGSTGALANTNPASSGFFVDKEGNIDIPILGKIKAAGYTTFQLKNIVYNLSLKYFKDPTVTVRLVNFKVSVTGEVLKPGEYILSDEKETIFDAIALAGDLTVFGKRENVLLIRENLDGTKTPFRINLKKSDVMSSPYYYLRQNDMIYVEPRKAKSDATDASQAKYITIAGALLSIILVLAYRVK